MNHSHLEKIYNDIKEEPYFVSTKPNIEAPNCYFKGLKFLKHATELGYLARGRVADIDWNDSPVPKEITDLIPDDIQEKHFYVEILIDDEWRTLDPSMDKGSEKLGFRSVSFKGDINTCFNLHKRYSHEEQIAEFKRLNDNSMKDYFDKMTPFLVAFNQWIEAEREKL